MAFQTQRGESKAREVVEVIIQPQTATHMGIFINWKINMWLVIVLAQN